MTFAELLETIFSKGCRIIRKAKFLKVQYTVHNNFTQMYYDFLNQSKADGKVSRPSFFGVVSLESLLSRKTSCTGLVRLLANWQESSSSAVSRAWHNVSGLLCLNFNLISSSCNTTMKWSLASVSMMDSDAPGHAILASVPHPQLILVDFLVTLSPTT